MDIDGLGESIIESLIQRELIKSPADIYYLTLDELKSLWQKGDLAAKKLLSAIEGSKDRDVSKLIYALGIRQVGAKTGKVLGKTFGSLDALMEASVEQLQETLLRALRALVLKNRPSETSRFTKLLLKLPDLRTLNNMHSEKLLSFRVDAQ